MKLAIICPVKDSASTLPRLLDSYLAQTAFSECVAYFVLDPSTDETERILSAFSAKYPEHAKIIRADAPQGPGLNRITGIRASEEPFVSFMDSDDELMPDYAKTIIETLSQGYDAIDFSFFTQTRGKRHLCKMRGAKKVLDRYKAIRLLLNDSSMRGFLWCKAFCREVLLNDPLVLPQNLFEDMPLAFSSFLHCERIAYIRTPLYVYWKRNGSAMRGNNRERPSLHVASFLAMFEYAVRIGDKKVKKIVSSAYFRMKLSLKYDIGLAKKDGFAKKETSAILLKLRSLKQNS